MDARTTIPLTESVPAAPRQGRATACGCGESSAGAPELDVRAIPHAIRHATVFGAWSAIPAGGSLVAIPIAPAPDLQIAVSSAPSAPAGDVWPTSVGFVSALPAVGPGHYTATLTFTVIGL